MKYIKTIWNTSYGYSQLPAKHLFISNDYDLIALVDCVVLTRSNKLILNFGINIHYKENFMKLTKVV